MKVCAEIELLIFGNAWVVFIPNALSFTKSFFCFNAVETNETDPTTSLLSLCSLVLTPSTVV